MVLPYDNMDYGVDEVGARNITELTDVELTNLANGEVLKYNSVTNVWENQPDSAGGGSLDALTDTDITSVLNGQLLRYNSTSSKWENFTLLLTDTDNLVDLTDTNITSVANGEVLKYNSSNSKWENSNLNLNEIGDVNITSLQNGETLRYNSTSGKWENQDNTDTLNELTDVTLSSSSNNQVLKYNGSIWVNNFVNLTELADTNISTLNNGDILRYNSVSQKWETDTFNINDLDNVNITGVANNEILKYNSVTSKWENSNRIDTLDELGDVTLTSVTTGDLLRYNGSNFINTKIAFDNDFTNVNFTSLTNGDLIKYDGSNFINFAPTYLDGAGITDNYLIKVVGGSTVQTSFIESSTFGIGTSLRTYIPLSGGINLSGGTIETEIFDTVKTRMHLTSTGIAYSNGITITSDGRVGIGVVAPEEDLHLDGNFQLDTGGVQRSKIIFYDGQNQHEHAEIDALGDGTNGGALVFYTKVDNGSVTEKLRITNDGKIGVGLTNPTHEFEMTGIGRSDEFRAGIFSTTVAGYNVYDRRSITAFKIGPNGPYTVHSLLNGRILAEIVPGLGDTIQFDNPIFIQNCNIGLLEGATSNQFSSGPAYIVIRSSGSPYYFYGNHNYNVVSDDRLKHNEEDLTNCLETIRKLKPQKYQKTNEMKDPDYNGELTEEWVYEAGLIAQEVMEIPELKWCVNGGGVGSRFPGEPETEQPYVVSYSDILMYHLQATKELDTIVQSQQSVIQNLISRIEALEGTS